VDSGTLRHRGRRCSHRGKHGRSLEGTSDCGKFYCPDHGDRLCVSCRGGEKADPFPDLGEPTEWPGPAKAGPVCYVCLGTTVGACTICGKFYCPEHGGKQQGVWCGRRGLCEPCQQSQNTRVKVALLIAVAWAGIMFSAMIYFARSADRQGATVVPEPPAPLPQNPLSLVRLLRTNLSSVVGQHLFRKSV
jgi:hypothetical protein